jgi:hypothetical protein
MTTDIALLSLRPEVPKRAFGLSEVEYKIEWFQVAKIHEELL